MASLRVRSYRRVGDAAPLVAAAGAAALVALSTQPAASRPLAPAQPRAPLTLTTRWAGYLARARAGSFTEVSGRWRQPAVACAGRGSSASVWVGLGGADPDSRAVEQIGSSADCPDGILPQYSLWYELFPAPPVAIHLPVRPGDLLAARVSVHDGVVAVALTNLTRGRHFARSVPFAEPETDSAEWIVEAPALCLGSCGQLLLADFARVSFSSTAAATGAYRAPLGAAGWRGERLAIAAHGSILAAPSALGADGGSFAVGYRRLD